MQGKPVVATVIDDEGTEYELSVVIDQWNKKFHIIEQEAKERGIRYADTTSVRFPEGI